MTDYFAKQHRKDLLMRRILDKLDDTVLDYVELAPGQFDFLFITQAETPVAYGCASKPAAASRGGCGTGGCGSCGA